MDAQRIEQLRAEARYARERYDLYRQKVYSLRNTSPVRLRELELASRNAQERLARALRQDGLER
jgi:hypothetical protein